MQKQRDESTIKGRNKNKNQTAINFCKKIMKICQKVQNHIKNRLNYLEEQILSFIIINIEPQKIKKNQIFSIKNQINKNF